MRRLTIGSLCFAAMLVAGACYYRSSARSSAMDSSHQLVAALAAKEHHMLKLIDVAGCRDAVVSGQEQRLEASSSRVARQDLARKADLVAQYCTCKFHATESFLTKGEMITQWLSAQASLSDNLPAETRARLDKVVEDCAQKYGLRT